MPYRPKRFFRHSRGRPRRSLIVEPLEVRAMLAGDGSVWSVPHFSPPLESSVSAYVNQVVTDDSGVQQMPSIAVHPQNPEHVVIAYMDYSLHDSGYAAIAAAVSHDGGRSYQHVTLPFVDGFEQGAAHPIVRFDGAGRVFISFMATTFFGDLPTLTNPGGGPSRALGLEANNGVFVVSSDDGGITWNAPVPVAANLFNLQDQVAFEIFPDLAIDTFPLLPDGQANPYFGNLYLTWARYYPPGMFPGVPDATGGSDVMFAVSEDGGQTWQVRTQPHPETGEAMTVLQTTFNLDFGWTGTPGFGLNNWPRATVGPAGDVYVAIFSGQWFTVNHSLDAGATFFIPTEEDEIGLPFGDGSKLLFNSLVSNQFRTVPVRAIAADPSRPGYVYAAEPLGAYDTLSRPLDEADISFARSTDYGRTWEQTVIIGGQLADVLNDDNGGRTATGSPHDVTAAQVMVQLSVDSEGNIGLIWYDARRDPLRHKLDVFGTTSTDGGFTFSSNFRMSDQSFDANAGRFIDATGEDNFYLGDRIGLALGNGFAYAAWTDTRNGNQDIAFTRLPIHPVPAPPNDRFEPNDTAATATPLGVVVQHFLPRLRMGGDEDWFSFQATASGSVTVTLQSQANTGGARVELWDSTGTVLLTTSSDGQLAYPASSGDVFHILVASDGEDSEYAIQVQSLTADLGSVAHRTIDGRLGSGEQAVYLLEAAAAGSILAIVTTDDTSAPSWSVELIDPQQFTVESGSSATVNARTELAVKQGQLVLVRVKGESAVAGTFRLTLTNTDQFSATASLIRHFPAGPGPSQATVADFNLDGHPDIAVTNTGANVVSVLLGNGDGTFQSPRQFPVGAFRVPNPIAAQTQLTTYRRIVSAADFNNDGLPDLAVTNYDSSDVSILLGRGDGSFETQRRFDATAAPIAMTVGDVNNDGRLDLVVADSLPALVPNTIAVLLGRGDGSFQPQRRFAMSGNAEFPGLALADLNDDGRLDLVVVGRNSPGIDIYHGGGDGSFTLTDVVGDGRLGTDLLVADVTGDGLLDILANSRGNGGEINLVSGKEDSAWGDSRIWFPGEGPLALAWIDVGSEVVSPDDSIALGPRDGHRDLVVANSGASFAFTGDPGPPEIVVLPAIVDADGSFQNFGIPQRLASAFQPLDLDVSDVDGDGVEDVIVVDRDGVFVIFGEPQALTPNDTFVTARNLGTVVHSLQPTLTITPDQKDAYFRLTVPTEAAISVREQVIDFSALFEATTGAGLGLEVRNSTGSLLGTGERFRVRVRQGEELMLHVFGLTGPEGVPGYGAYTLAISTLPQVVSVEAQSLLPGVGGLPGGPTTTLTLAFQGDRLQPEFAQDPHNYRVTWLGADAVAGTDDDRVISVGAGLPSSQAALYSPSSNAEVSSGRTYPTVVRQTVTLLFSEPLPPGAYQIEVSPNVRAAPFNLDEQSRLASLDGFNGHPVVSLAGDEILEGVALEVRDLVKSEAEVWDLSLFEQGTRFLTQLHNDLGALLDAQLTAIGDDPEITERILEQIVARLDPALRSASERLVSVLVVFLDPVSIGLVDPSGQSFRYDLETNTVNNSLPRTFVEVGGNVEIMVIAEPRGTYQLDVANVAAHARGGAIFLGRELVQIRSITNEMRAGSRSFSFETETETATGLNDERGEIVARVGLPAPSLTTTVGLYQPTTSSANERSLGALGVSASPRTIASVNGFSDRSQFRLQEGPSEADLMDRLGEFWEQASELWDSLWKELADQFEPLAEAAAHYFSGLRIWTTLQSLLLRNPRPARISMPTNDLTTPDFRDNPPPDISSLPNASAPSHSTFLPNEATTDPPASCSGEEREQARPSPSSTPIPPLVETTLFLATTAITDFSDFSSSRPTQSHQAESTGSRNRRIRFNVKSRVDC